jgi:hypothetical protein
MAHHHTIKYNSYQNFSERINTFQQGEVDSDLLFKVSKILFSDASQQFKLKYLVGLIRRQIIKKNE